MKSHSKKKIAVLVGAILIAVALISLVAAQVLLWSSNSLSGTITVTATGACSLWLDSAFTQPVTSLIFTPNSVADSTPTACVSENMYVQYTGQINDPTATLNVNITVPSGWSATWNWYNVGSGLFGNAIPNGQSVTYAVNSGCSPLIIAVNVLSAPLSLVTQASTPETVSAVVSLDQ
jgi:hypothetical protein